MKRFDFSDCLREGLLRNVPPSNEKAEGSIRTAEKWLDEARKDLENDAFNSSILSSYLAIFHSARAILFFDGLREKSHYCIARYLEEKYAKKGLLENKWIELLDHYREMRHNSQYDINFFTSKSEAATAFNTATEFVKRLKNLLEKRKGR